MTNTRTAWRILATATGLALLLPVGSAAQTAIRTTDMMELRPRSIGPAVTGGRVHDIEAVPSDPSTLYVASASGGLWKSTTRGQTWVNVFDTMAVSTFGDVALAPSDPEIVYAGTGEQNNRQSTSYGNGVYRSDDGGTTWRHLGLAETRAIGKVEISPADPDVAFVAAEGNLWAATPERGVYRTRDGGRTWDKVLFVDDFTGAVDLVMNPSDPDVLYAAMYQHQRRAWGYNGGGPGSGIYMTTDGGDHWTELTDGLPSGDKGRIGLAISRSNPRVLEALVESADRDQQGTYRSEDGGMTWERVNPQDGRPMYYSEIFIDPNDPDRVYTLATSSYVSEDGGRNFTEIALAPTYDVGVHSDHHALWIDPNDSNHLYLGGDAGLWESYDRGQHFRKINNFPIGQFYNIAVDMRDPYWVYGGLQDNHSFMGPSRTRRWAGIVNDDWMEIGFGDGMYWEADPRDARYAYGSSNGGAFFRLDPATGDMLDIEPQPKPGEAPYRFDWTAPSLLSQHDPDVLYIAGNRFFTTRDHGETWTRTEDLSRRIDRDTLEIMGVKGADIAISPNDGTSSFGEATTIGESPLDPAVLWVGFDDGNLQVSRDGGATWTEVSHNVRGVPDGTYVSRVVASSRGTGVAYATFDAHRDGDFQPYVFRTEDFGATWTPLMADLPDFGSVNVIVEHPDNADVLFVGTENSLFASTDAGAHWAKVPNLPTTLYDDILIHPREKDLVIGTHGRSVWILDDTRPLAEWSASQGRAAYIFPVHRGTLFQYRKDTSYRGNADFAGQNPPDGVFVTYRLGAGSGDATLRVTRKDGQVVREMTVPAAPGMHRVTWDLRHALPGRPDVWERHADTELARPIGQRGPFVSPGTYTVTLAARGTETSRTVEV
ncbi:MAG: glycosyl hydrolase, partial [Gemmatimonadota bacterium]